MSTFVEKLKVWVSDIKVWITAFVVAAAEYAFNIIDKIQAFFV